MYGKVAMILACAWLCAGCVAQPIRSDVSVFHQLRTALPGKTFAFIELEAQQATPEYDAYRRLVEEHLLTAGMREAARPIESDYLVAIDYFAASPLQLIVHIPAFGQTGVSISSTTGDLQAHGTTSTVQLATSGALPSSAASYERGFTMLMYETATAIREGDAKPVYEGRVSNAGNSSPSKVLPTMIEALFQRFPGRSGDLRMALVR
jgi:Domain of unknown function (DUF4136)